MSSKEAVLAILKGKIGTVVSGQELSSKLNISRTAVWKAAGALKVDGYLIEAVPRRGYVLLSLTEKLLSSEIGQRPPGSFGHIIHHFEDISSTNEVAKRLAQSGGPHGTLVISETQSGGKGRLGRTWRSPSGGIWISLIARADIDARDGAKITPLMALAVAKAIKWATGLEAKIKWPNDILINGRKVAGILTEMAAELDRIDFLVIGLGLNVNFNRSNLPKELCDRATTLMDEMGARLDRAAILRAILSEFDSIFARFLKGERLGLTAEIKEISATLGQTVTILSGSEEVSGKACDFDDLGGLVIEQFDGKRRVVHSGEIV